MFSSLEFSELSKKVGETWNNLPDNVKQVYRIYSIIRSQWTTLVSSDPWHADCMLVQHTTCWACHIINPSTGPAQKRRSCVAETKVSHLLVFFLKVWRDKADVANQKVRDLQTAAVPQLNPIDMAAHLRLLGESLLTIGVCLGQQVRFLPGAGGGLPTIGVCLGQQVGFVPWPGGRGVYSHIWAIRGCAAQQGMVFASLNVEQGLQISVSLWNRVNLFPSPTLEHC